MCILTSHNHRIQLIKWKYLNQNRMRNNDQLPSANPRQNPYRDAAGGEETQQFLKLKLQKIWIANFRDRERRGGERRKKDKIVVPRKLRASIWNAGWIARRRVAVESEMESCILFPFSFNLQQKIENIKTVNFSYLSQNVTLYPTPLLCFSQLSVGGTLLFI